MNKLSLLTKSKTTLFAIVFWVTGSLYGAFGTNSIIQDVLIFTLIWTGVAISWNLTAGYAGRLSLGHAAYFGIGAYTSSILYMKFGISPWIGAAAGMFIAAFVGVLIEATTIRLLGIYYSLATFAIAELLGLMARGWTELTNGMAGLTLPFKASLIHMTFTNKTGYFFIALGFVLLCFTTTALIVNSRYGFYLKAQRDELVAAKALGIATNQICIVSGMISAALTALGGTIYAQYLLYIDPDIGFNWYISVQAALLCLIGGMGTLVGPIIGGILLVPLERVLHSLLGGSYGGLAPAIYGGLLIVIVLLMPKGIASMTSKIKTT